MPRITMYLIRERDPERYHVSVTIGDDDHILGTYGTATEAGRRMRAWVDGRGLHFAPDSAQRLNQAEAVDADMLTLDVLTCDFHNSLEN